MRHEYVKRKGYPQGMKKFLVACRVYRVKGFKMEIFRYVKIEIKLN